MAWGNCPTHGAIQDAKSIRIGKPYETQIFCKCGLECAPYSPETWIDPSTAFRAGQDIIAEAAAQEAASIAEARDKAAEAARKKAEAPKVEAPKAAVAKPKASKPKTENK